MFHLRVLEYLVHVVDGASGHIFRGQYSDPLFGGPKAENDSELRHHLGTVLKPQLLHGEMRMALKVGALDGATEAGPLTFTAHADVDMAVGSSQDTHRS